MNAEATVILLLPTLAGAVFATVQVETRDGRIVAMRVVRDPAKLASLQTLVT